MTPTTASAAPPPSATDAADAPPPRKRIRRVDPPRCETCHRVLPVPAPPKKAADLTPEKLEETRARARVNQRNVRLRAKWALGEVQRLTALMKREQQQPAPDPAAHAPDAAPVSHALASPASAAGAATPP